MLTSMLLISLSDGVKGGGFSAAGWSSHQHNASQGLWSGLAVLGMFHIRCEKPSGVTCLAPGF